MKKHQRYSILSLAASLVLIVAYNNCSKVAFEAQLPTGNELATSAGITINKGAQFTNAKAVAVQLKNPWAAQMYVTNDSSCESGGDWQAFAEERPWTLAQTNQEAKVYARFKAASGAFLPCIEARIIHDDQPPSVEIKTPPKTYSRDATEMFELDGKDELSGIEKYECRWNAGEFVACQNLATSVSLSEGNQVFQTRSFDRAGNRSEIKDRFWIIDRTRPTLALTEAPSSTVPLTRTTAAFTMTANDVGSGLAGIKCRLDSQPWNSNCSAREVYTDLADGSHKFEAIAIDRAGNESDQVSTQFTVDTTPSSDFLVTGVTGGADTTKDALLGTTLTPTVHWSRSLGAVEYALAILNTDGSVACPERRADGALRTLAFNPADCKLIDGSHYAVRATAYDASGLTHSAPSFSFRVDATGPTITIAGPLSSDPDRAKFDFTITDASGVQAATCTKTFKGAAQSFNCKDINTYTFENLVSGEHAFAISASDNAGNTSISQPIKWMVKLIVCDPFSTATGACKRGLRSNLYYLAGKDLQDQLVADKHGNHPLKYIDDYLRVGKQANAVIYFSQLAGSRREFDKGFSTESGSPIKNDAGEVLIEHFALDMETIVKLGPDDLPGYYQFALFTDDGSKMFIKKNPKTPYELFIDNDGYHPARFKADASISTDAEPIFFDATKRLPARIQYFQGPRTHIALMLMWRRVESLTVPRGQKSLPDDIDHRDYEATGWRVMKPENFILSEEVQ